MAIIICALPRTDGAQSIADDTMPETIESLCVNCEEQVPPVLRLH